jgi:hypothetical protein
MEHVATQHAKSADNAVACWTESSNADLPAQHCRNGAAAITPAVRTLRYADQGLIEAILSGTEDMMGPRKKNDRLSSCAKRRPTQDVRFWRNLYWLNESYSEPVPAVRLPYGRCVHSQRCSGFCALDDDLSVLEPRTFRQSCLNKAGEQIADRRHWSKRK